MTKATATKPQAAKSDHPLTIDRVRKAAVAISPNTSVRYLCTWTKAHITRINRRSVHRKPHQPHGRRRPANRHHAAAPRKAISDNRPIEQRHDAPTQSAHIFAPSKIAPFSFSPVNTSQQLGTRCALGQLVAIWSRMVLPMPRRITTPANHRIPIPAIERAHIRRHEAHR